MNTTRPPQRLKARLTLAELQRLLNGPPAGSPWPSAEQAFEEIEQLLELNERLERARTACLRDALDAPSDQVSEELEEIALAIFVATNRICELQGGGPVDWERVYSMPELSHRDHYHWLDFYKRTCAYERRTLKDWVDAVPYQQPGRSEVLGLLVEVAAGTLTKSSIYAAYRTQFFFAPSPDCKLDYPATSREASIRRLKSESKYAFWELERIAEGLKVKPSWDPI